MSVDDTRCHRSWAVRRHGHPTSHRPSRRSRSHRSHLNLKKADMSDFQTLLYESPAAHIARITLNRPDTRNAQDTKLLYELNDAFDRAARDDAIKVIILAANGPHFSSGHDLRERDAHARMKDFRTVGTWCGFECAGAEAQMAREKEIYV